MRQDGADAARHWTDHSAAYIRDDLALDPGRRLDHSLRLENLE